MRPIVSSPAVPVCVVAVFISGPRRLAGDIASSRIAGAYAGPGVAHLTLPQDVLAAKAGSSVSSIATLKPRPEFSASEQDTSEMARRIDPADRIVIMCGAGCRGANEELRKFSEQGAAGPFVARQGVDSL